MIENYNFGEVKISGKTYRSDVIVYPDHVDARWWRKRSHNLEVDDIREIIDAHPDIIIIGTGQPGMLKVNEETMKRLKQHGIKTMVLPTEKACQAYNQMAHKKKVIACLHLTC